MLSLEIIAIFIVPVLGLLVLQKRYHYQWLELILHYFFFLVGANLLTNLLWLFFRSGEFYHFTIIFFVKYSVVNLLSSLFLAFKTILWCENFHFNLKLKK